MNEIMKALKSRTVWTVIAMVTLTTVQMAQPFMSSELFMLINGILGALVTYFKLNPSQNY